MLVSFSPELVEDAAGDREMIEMAAEEAKALEQQIKELEGRLKVDFILDLFLETYLEELSLFEKQNWGMKVVSSIRFTSLF